MIPMRYNYGNQKMAAGLLGVLLVFLLLPLRVFADAEKSVTVRIPVSCMALDSPDTFEYELIPETTEHQTIENTTLSLKDGEKGEFVITITYPGTYHYTVRQEKGEDLFTTYDERVYHVDVYVMEDEQGNLTADVVLYEEGGADKKEELVFKNRRELPPDEPKEDEPTPEDKPKEEPQGILGFLTVPQTGDSAPLGLWLVLAAAAALGMAVLLVLKMRKKREDDADE